MPKISKKLVAIDLGNKQIKIKTSKSNGEYVFPTAMLPKEELNQFSLLLEEKTPVDLFRTDFNDNEKMYFGENIDTLGHSEELIESLGFDEERYKSESFRVMMLYSLAKAVSDFNEEMTICDLVIGLPPTDLQANIQRDLAKFIKGRHIVSINEKKIYFDVASVNFIPQYLGTIAEMSYDYINDGREVVENNSLFATSKVGIVDIGGGTVLTDISEKKAVGNKKSAIPREDGIFTVLRELSYDLKIDQHQINKIMREGSEEKGYFYEAPNPIYSRDITKEIMDKRLSYTRKIGKIIHSAFPKINQLAAIYLTGGGANILLLDVLERDVQGIDRKSEEALNEHGKILHLIENSETANVRGYFKIGILQGLGEYV